MVVPSSWPGLSALQSSFPPPISLYLQGHELAALCATSLQLNKHCLVFIRLGFCCFWPRNSACLLSLGFLQSQAEPRYPSPKPQSTLIWCCSLWTTKKLVCGGFVQQREEISPGHPVEMDWRWKVVARETPPNNGIGVPHRHSLPADRCS